MAGIFERMSTIIKSNVNDLLSNFEDPEKMIDQTIIDATKEYGKAKEQALNTLANEKLAKKKLDDYNAEADKWHSIAAKALRAGNEGDARSALENESQARAKAEAQEKAYEATKSAADTVRAKLAQMEDQIRQMKAKSDEIKATAAAAKATKAASKVTQMGIDESAFATFARMEEKAHRELAKAQAMDDLSVNKEEDKDKALELKYGSNQPGTDEALAALKAELGM
ncbi:MAG: PspA/IM30 family protein [Clostridiales bacterium]|nr:PspA/IM30 family protein [Clostridiales bacterium]